MGALPFDIAPEVLALDVPTHLSHHLWIKE